MSRDLVVYDENATADNQEQVAVLDAEILETEFVDHETTEERREKIEEKLKTLHRRRT